MRKDTQNVLITFSLIAVTLISGSLLHTTMVRAENASIKLTAEREQDALEAQILLGEQLLQIEAMQETAAVQPITQEVTETKQKQITPVTVPKTPVVPDTTVTQAQIDKQKADATALAKKIADEKKLAQQIADAKLAAEKLAKQQAADAATAASKPSRNSSAS